MPEKKQIKKFIGIPIEKELTHSEDGHLLARGFFTSDKLDEFGDIITKDATERALEAYRQWGNIRYMHQPKPVGKVTGIGKADGLKWNEVEFKIINKDAAYEVEQGLLSAMSVGILVNWDDIEFMDEGGFKILDYQLAEISLVDHPANYDAVLKGVPATEGLRYLAREYGFETVAREMASLLNLQTEGNMPKKDKVADEVIEEEVSEPAEESEEEETVEAEKSAEAETEEVDAEKSAEAETEEVDAEEEAPEEEEAEEVVMEASLTEAFDKFNTGFEKLFAILEAQSAKLDLLLDSPETPAEDQGTDQSESEDEEQEAEEVDRSLEDDDDEESAPVSRDGQIAPTDTMDLSDGDEEEEPVAKDLSEALHRFFGVNQEV